MKLSAISRAIVGCLAIVATLFCSSGPAPASGSTGELLFLGSYGAIDRQTATTTVYKAFSVGGSSAGRVATKVSASYANTQPIYYVSLPRGTTAPANLAAIQAYAECVTLYPGDVLNGGTTDTSASCDLYVAAGSGSQSVTFAEITQADPTATISRASTNGSVTVSGTTTVSAVPATSGGVTGTYSLDITTTSSQIKATAGQVYGWSFTNNNTTTTLWVKFYNATSATSASTPVYVLSVPPSDSKDMPIGAIGIAFSTAICIRGTVGRADNDNTAPTAGDLTGSVFKS